ncbi:MAG TPA: hypothetical protein VH589_08620, partial [Trebonia sp.]
NAAIHNRALDYKTAKVRPGARIDQLRVLAFLDLLNGITLTDRITQARTDAGTSAADDPAGTSRPGAADGAGPARPGDDGSADNGDGNHTSSGGDACPRDRHSTDTSRGSGGDASTRNGSRHGDHGPGSDRPGSGSEASPRDGSGADRSRGSGDAASTSGSDRSGDSAGPGAPGGTSSGAAAPAGPALAARANLTLPLATLLGIADRPGTAHGLGPLDPALVRDLAAAAATSPHTEWSITITDTDGTAIAHGRARPARTSKARTPAASRDGPQTWALTRRGQPGPASRYGTWTLTLPGGRQLTVTLTTVPVTDCDHRYQSRGYQPNDTLRRLVQVRDGTCTFPTCSRHARESDFEHAVPYDRGGRTCTCNGSARSRRCHHVKQSDGWTVTQPQPGTHQWTTPSGRTYTQGPMRYPA